MLCSTCHQEIASDATQCPHCGAPVNGASPSDNERGARRHGRGLRLATVVASLVAVVSTGFGAFSWHQQRQIAASYRQAQVSESESLAATAEQLLGQGDRMEAIQLALAALPESSHSDDRPLVPSAQLALERALQVYPQASLWRSAYSMKEVRDTYASSELGLQAFERLDGSVDVWDIASGSKASTLDVRAEIAEVTSKDVDTIKLRFCGDRLMGYATGGLAVFDPATGSLSWRASVDGFTPGSDIVPAPDGEHIALACSFGPAHVIGDDRSDVVIVRLINIADGSVSQGFKLPLDEWGQHTDEVRLAYSPDGGLLTVANSGRLWIIDLATGDVNWTTLPGSDACDLAFAEGHVVVVSSDGSYESTDLGEFTDPEIMQLSCYSPELYPLWTVSYETDVVYDSHGAPLITDTRIVGTQPPAEDDPAQLVITTGRTARYLDLETGEELWQVAMPSPIRASMLTSQLYLVDQDGNVNANATASDDENAELMQLTVAEGSTASFGYTNGKTHLAAYDAGTSTYRVYLFCPQADAPSRESLKSKYLHEGHATFGEGTERQMYLSFDDTEVAGLDANTLKRQWKRSWAKLDLDESVCGLDTGAECAYVFETEHGGSELPVICVLNPADGKVTDRIELSEDWDSVIEVKEQTREGRTLLAIRSQSTAAVIDAATHEELLRATAASGEILGMWFGEHALLVLEAPSFGGSTNAFELFSLEDGSAVTAPITSYATKATSSALLADADEANGRLAVSCADGLIRAFDTTDWSVVWEGTEELSGLSALVYGLDGSSLLAQDSAGSCLLLSASDGHVLTTSSAKLPPISGVQKDLTHPDRLTVTYGQTGMASGEGIATISLDPECFGPASETFGGMYLTSDGQRVLAFDRASDPMFSTYHRYTLDELIELAHQTIEGHELTNAERRRYRID